MAKQPATFTDILDRPATDFERPKPLPMGTYVMLIKGLPRFDKSSKKQTPFVEFMCDIVSAGDDVDEEALAEMGGIAGKQMKATFYTTEEATYRLREFLGHCGLDEAEYGSLRQMIEAAPGSQFFGTIIHEATQDGQGVFARLGTTAPVA